MPPVKARFSVSAQRHCVPRGVQHGFPMVVTEHLTGTLFPARQVEVLDGVEPTTACLQNRCSAIELQYRKWIGWCGFNRVNAQQDLPDLAARTYHTSQSIIPCLYPLGASALSEPMLSARAS